jgi:ABC-type transporter Mla MlaB component
MFPGPRDDREDGHRSRVLARIADMGFFFKPSVKKPAPGKPDARPAAPSRPASAHEVAAQVVGRAAAAGERRPVDPVANDITVADASMIEWAAPGQPAFEVVAANPGLCEVLENAALFYASGKADLARSTLEHGVQADHDARTSPLAWLALFDLLQRAGDRAAFDRMAMIYVVEFERSAPAWEERHVAPIGARATPAGYVLLSGKLTAASAGQIEGLRRVVAKQVAKARLDLGKVTGCDDVGARLLADALGAARFARFALEIQHAEALRPTLESAVRQGREGGEGAWLLSLELMQWQNDRAAFEDRAIEFAVAFELSPPSWEPPPAIAQPGQPAEVDDAKGAAAAAGESEALRWSGEMIGPTTPQLAKLPEFAHRRSVVPVDMTDVERIDFVCAAALLNTINNVELQRKSVQIVGASPIIRALLLLIGISPRHFVKKSD